LARDGSDVREEHYYTVLHSGRRSRQVRDPATGRFSDVDANTYSLKQILSQERRYIIPTFQRDYEWDRENQWELLFEDVEVVTERLAEARRHAEQLGKPTSGAEKKVAPHFLGAVVCDQLPAPAGGIDLRAVIDGQQRLTTLQLLLRGVLDVLVERGSSRAKQVRRLLRNPSDVVEEEYESYKLWPRRKDREVWPSAIDDATPPPGDHPYLLARTYFAERAKQAVVGPGGEDWTDHLVDALLDLFKLVVIDLEDNDDAQVIFEVLNGRQTPLSATDLVKNLLFLRGELLDEKELEAVYDEYWAHFDHDWWKENVGRGHAARGRRDVLLSSWLTAASATEINVGHLYGEVRRYLDGADRKTEDVLAELADYSRAYEVVQNDTVDAGSPVLRRSYKRLTGLGFSTTLPLLLWLRTLPAERMTPADHEAAVLAVESWVLRRLFTGANTRGYGKVFVDVLAAAQEAARQPATSIAATIVTTLSSRSSALTWPTDDDLETAFVGRKVYEVWTQERIRLLLGALDAQLQAENKHTEPATFHYGRLQIEHVMPRSWRQHWPLTGVVEPQLTLDSHERDRVVHRLGNLTLVTSTFNQAVSNSGWSVKRPEFAKQSKLQLNVEISGSELWDEQAIEQRARSLSSVAARVWPSPEALLKRLLGAS
jgi:hypothetical protein